MYSEETTALASKVPTLVCIRMIPIMFKITENTLRDFTLAEVLLMAAMNQLESKRRVDAGERSLPAHCHCHAKAA